MSAGDNPLPGDILVVDDTLANLKLLANILSQAGYQVRPAADGELALRSAQAKPPALILLDIRMPGVDGFEVCRRLQADERTRDIPVIFLSALTDTADKSEAFALGAVDYIDKPFHAEEVLARVRTHIALAAVREQLSARNVLLQQANEKLCGEIAERKRLETERDEHEQRFRALSRRLVEVQEDERRELSTELHDRASPDLAAIKINLSMLSKILYERGTEDVRVILEDTAGLLANTIVSIREISSNLRPTVLDDGGLLPALTGYAQQFMQRTGIAVLLQTQDATRALSPALQSSLFRIVQEALANCAKHAKAKNVTIRLNTEGDRVSLTIADDGVGFDVERQSTHGLGLLTMRERAEFAGGSFSLETKPGLGTRIQVLV